jgi:hypothetical protein
VFRRPADSILKKEEGPMKSGSPMNGDTLPSEEDSIWDQFRDDIEMLARLRVTPQEVTALKNCVLLGTLTCKQDMLFILRQIRIATGEESEDSDDTSYEMTFTPAPIPRRVTKPKHLAKNFSAPANHPAKVSNRGTRKPGSPAAIIRSLALVGGALVLAGFLTRRVVAGMSSGRRHLPTTIGVEAHKPVAPGVVRHPDERG